LNIFSLFCFTSGISLGENLVHGSNSAAALHNLDQTPTLGLAEWAALLDANKISYLTGVLFVVRMKTLCLLVRSFIDTMFLQGFYDNYDRFIHFVAHYTPDLLDTATFFRSTLL
jgi:hypothetical protein